ncbi:glycosyltransferase family 32 protein [Phocaeicola faecium]|uniref:Glycosyl transferase n=1 Tax=Phocaeicola faecium TaxID=2762213 RepID=A0ABR8VF77_9BACT|nr:glycosyltransferase [Phocaeicola faecium]MBD8003436.1 glycosyl transferase [Phocaeicola faecium]
MIPKIIHYCWFGGNPLPQFAIKCIESWRKYFPNYEIKEWNERNFDVNIIPYTRDAYLAKKYAFVSDYARFWILYHYGGIYFDTDVEVIRSMNDLLDKGGFMGCEIDKGDNYSVAPGLGIASEAHHPLYYNILEKYKHLPFFLEENRINPYAVVRITTDALFEAGLLPQPKIQTIQNITIYPADFFNPWNDVLGKMNKTSNTRSIHWYSKTWMKPQPIIWVWIKRYMHRILGIK